VPWAMFSRTRAAPSCRGALRRGCRGALVLLRCPCGPRGARVGEGSSSTQATYLTERQRQVLRSVALGYSTREIGPDAGREHEGGPTSTASGCALHCNSAAPRR